MLRNALIQVGWIGEVRKEATFPFMLELLLYFVHMQPNRVLVLFFAGLKLAKKLKG